MQTYIGFLRGINVGGHRPVKMEVLRQVLGALGLQGVSTYVQSGNLVFRSGTRDAASLTAEVEATLETAFGFAIPTVLLQPSPLREFLAANPFADRMQQQGNKMYYVLWKSDPDASLEERLREGDYPGQEWQVGSLGLYLWCGQGYGKARLDNNRIERMAGTQATTRNHKTLSRLLEMAEAL